MKAKIAGVGYYLPDRILTNNELAQMVDTSDEWIKERVGIQQRHIASGHETNSYMATQAARMALEHAGIATDELDLIIVATGTPDQFMPSVACFVQAELKASCPAFDIGAACSGFIYGLHTAQQYIAAGSCKNILLIGSELMSRIVDWNDRSTCVLFGDGAGAVVLTASDETGMIASKIFANGLFTDLLYVTPQFSKQAFSRQYCMPHLKMEGNKVFRYAVEKLGEVVEAILKEAHLTQADIDWLIPHQANERIITATAKKLNLPMKKVILTLAKHGNTTAASIPLALAAAVDEGKIKRGDLMLLEAFGAGFVWGASIIRF